jgi:hypothetical protein
MSIAVSGDLKRHVVIAVQHLPIAVLLTAPWDRHAGQRRGHEHQSEEQVPKHFMGRVQNTFYFVGTFLQVTLES